VTVTGDIAIKPKKTDKTIPYRRDYVTIETADKISLEYRIANPLLRLGAFAIDTAILIVLYLLTLALIMTFDIWNRIGEMFNSDYFEAVLVFLYAILIFFFMWGYYTLFEIVFSGRTVGKMICRIRVIPSRGGHLTLSSIVLRNFARLIDQGLTLFWGAAVSMLATRDYRRIGDLLADTVVVKDAKPMAPDKVLSFELTGVQAGTQADPASFAQAVVRRLSEEELYLLRRFLNEQRRIPEPRRSSLLSGMAETIRTRIQDSVIPGESDAVPDPLGYLRSVYMRHANGVTIGHVRQ